MTQNLYLQKSGFVISITHSYLFTTAWFQAQFVFHHHGNLYHYGYLCCHGDYCFHGYRCCGKKWRHHCTHITSRTTCTADPRTHARNSDVVCSRREGSRSWCRVVRCEGESRDGQWSGSVVCSLRTLRTRRICSLVTDTRRKQWRWRTSVWSLVCSGVHACDVLGMNSEIIDRMRERTNQQTNKPTN